MSVKTTKKIITPSFSLSSSVIDIVATIPTSLDNKKIPITVNIALIDSNQASEDGEYRSDDVRDISETNLQCYHYSIPSRLKTQEVVSSVLLDTDNDYIRDITRQLSVLICKKYEHPCYVSWSSNGSINTTSMDHLSVIKECVAFIKELTSTLD
ncbi:hypothetical protein TPHA_0G01690 [Tetrapisispora phaffii CBS 4417]|uniref:Proteasome chaperone 4 n=1 Tax=Tetrapisispora phaffii (strain ATCC 24235 / CBS 4417 / NBRC 1672 / NRRL Y-8282 / UCD 70-5) TaxID=1071381 RepID=G8BVS7_TETPH|nr:hypothetical protein TPHA_0G01690 [Tetrapisispora phaffii CBS 4417]CCE64005.1 hypothetical protein TPHA_0G01690 [Tetrapisispora phaffii CBS 4417]